MLFDQRFWEPVARGEVTVTFRRWKRRQASPGRVQRTPLARIHIDAVDVVTPDDITAADAAAAGFGSVEELVGQLRGTPDLPIYRIRFHPAGGPDPRAELAASAGLTAEDVAEIDRRLDRLDAASRHGPWTREALELIRDRPRERAGNLAETVGRERLEYKADIRKLKNLGLTISLSLGYELSPRGQAYLDQRG